MEQKVSLRMCVACREMKPKEDLFHIVRSPEGNASLVPLGTYSPGRGAYLCKRLPCCEKAEKSRAFERALRIKIDPALYESLKGACESE